MTNNQIKLKEARETERSNRAKEQLEINKLNETIRNNNLINKVNITKNQIQRLYNQQLNRRELKKLAEQMNLAYDELNENSYFHDLQAWAGEEQRRLDKAIQENKSQTDMNRSLVGSFDNLVAQIAKFFFPGNTKVSFSPSQAGIAYDIMTGNGDVIKYQKLDLYPWQTGAPNVDGSFNYDYGKNPQGYANDFNSRSRSKNNQSSERAGYGVHFTASERPSRRTHYSRKRKLEEDEIPTDFSNSLGPAQTRTNTNGSSYDTGSGNSSGYSSSVHGSTSGGTDYTASGGHKSAGYIMNGEFHPTN